ncbi:uncharacterized protein EI90DRAFT_3125467 [Cantharellus anzutake]|uniref:uncharacterized protein n=1 Tax=Cantharellus anzutake TaxID=1750568 RepID=UPI0019081F42|nr:uncharacterized protein EI90DRAFT_3125467 [Cantharellus anzutake]KAF8329129.1 hypothetical protein EI90DRAFT_3125467 [Cantharellus anzutake]
MATAAAAPTVIKLPLGSIPRWEEGEDDASLIEDNRGEDAEQQATKTLKSIPEYQCSVITTARKLDTLLCSLVLLHTLRQSRSRWINNPPLTKFSVRHRGKTTIDIHQPPHSLVFLGRCDVEIGPHVFLDTKFMEVQWDNMYQPLTSAGSAPPTLLLRTDIIIELRENSAERFLLPLDGAVVERASERGQVFTLLSLLLDIPPESTPTGTPNASTKQPVNIRLTQGTTSIWEALDRRINATSPSKRSKAEEDFKKVAVNKFQRVFPPHRLPSGALFDEIEESVLDKIRPAPLQAKALRIGPPTPVAPPAKRRPPPNANKEKSVPKAVAAEGSTIIATEGSSTKKYERRTKVTCTVCSKAIARKTDDVSREGYKPMCRLCAFEARKAARASAKAYAASVAASRGPTPGLQVEVVVPRPPHTTTPGHTYSYYSTYLPPQQRPPYAPVYTQSPYRSISGTPTNLTAASTSGSASASTHTPVNAASPSRPPTYPYAGTVSSYPYFTPASGSTYPTRPYGIPGYYNAQSAQEWARSTFITTPGVHSPELPRVPLSTDRTPVTPTPPNPASTSTSAPAPTSKPMPIDPTLEEPHA